MQEGRATVHALLYDCITSDPRFDSQIEERADYYARLVLLTGLGLAPLEHYLRTVPHDRLDWEAALTIQTLGRLAQLGNSAAVPLLRDYVSYGAKWDYALQQLAELTEPGATVGLPEVICARFETGTLLENSTAYDLYSTPAEQALWKKWSADNPCIARLLAEVEQIEATRAQTYPRQKRPAYEEMSVEELLATVGRQQWGWVTAAELVEAKATANDEHTLVAAFSKANPFAWYAALRGLEALGRAEVLYPQILEQSVARLDSLPQANGPHIREVRPITHTLVLLPPAMTLPIARAWFNQENRHKESVAEDLLEQHATAEDYPMVLRVWTKHIEAAEDIDTYYTCSLLDILSRFRDIGPVPYVERVFIESGYTLARYRAAGAMQANAPQLFAETYAYECLWDCAEETRQLGCESVSLDVPGARQRLQAMADDPLESVREAARHRVVSADL